MSHFSLMLFQYCFEIQFSTLNLFIEVFMLANLRAYSSLPNNRPGTIIDFEKIFRPKSLYFAHEMGNFDVF